VRRLVGGATRSQVQAGKQDSPERPASSKKGGHMPKMKTKKSAAKRFVVRSSGSIKRGQAFKRHILTKKTTKAKRHLRGPVQLHEADVKSVRRMLPYA
jgi:large subunit ribosomal protein L35